MIQLNELNPVAKAGTTIICILTLAAFYDPWTPFLFLIWTLLVTFGSRQISWRKYIIVVPAVLIFSFGYFWTVLLFSTSTETNQVIAQIGSIIITDEALQKGLSLSFRVLAFSSVSFLFIFTTDPIKFIYSLMRQCKLSPKMAYGILAGFRFMPIFKHEFAMMQKAHRVRGLNSKKGMHWTWIRMSRSIIPMLANAIRKAERTAMAMESKGFSGDPNRTYYYEMKIGKNDFIFSGIMLLGLSISIYSSWALGSLQMQGVGL